MTNTVELNEKVDQIYKKNIQNIKSYQKRENQIMKVKGYQEKNK